MSYLGNIQQIVGNAPPYYVRNKHIGTLIEAAALLHDAMVETLAQGLLLTRPLHCDPSALPVLSRDRGIRIYETEPEASKRFRLSRWRQLRRQFGTHIGEMNNLAPYFLPAKPLMRIVHQDGAGGRATWWTLDSETGTITITKAEPSNWDYDGQTPPWSRWWLILYYETALAWLAPAEYDGGAAYDDGTLWDGGPSAEQAADVVAALKEAQGPHSMLYGVIVTHEPSSFDPTAVAVTDAEGWTSLPTGNWDRVIDDDTGFPTRPPYASFIYDKGIQP